MKPWGPVKVSRIPAVRSQRAYRMENSCGAQRTGSPDRSSDGRCPFRSGGDRPGAWANSGPFARFRFNAVFGGCALGSRESGRFGRSRSPWLGCAQTNRQSIPADVGVFRRSEAAVLRVVRTIRCRALLALHIEIELRGARRFDGRGKLPRNPTFLAGRFLRLWPGGDRGGLLSGIVFGRGLIGRLGCCR